MVELAGMNELNQDASELPISSSSGSARCFASSFGRQHFLWSLQLPPLGTLLSGPGHFDQHFEVRESLCARLSWRMPPFATISLHVIGTLPRTIDPQAMDAFAAKPAGT